MGLLFKAGERVFLPGSSGEPAGVLEALFATPGAQVLTSFVPGVNRLPADDARAARVTGLFGHPGAAHLPISYGGFARRLAGGDVIDTAIVQVSPPDSDGQVSFGPAVEFGQLALRVASRRIAVVNAAVKPSHAAPCIGLDRFDAVVEHTAPLRTSGSGAPDAVSTAIATRVAAFIGDGATLQTGLGKVPAALMGLLSDRRRLRLHTGMVSDGVQGLVAAGALERDHAHLTTVFLGSTELYDWAAEQDLIRVAGCETTHDPRRLAAIDGLVAVNSALEVDLFGQCNLESAGGRQVSGCGGAPDFARAAHLSQGGVSLVALPSTFGADRASRIRARLSEPGLLTLPRHDVDVVVTEHGTADLRGLTSAARARALIEVAAPFARSELTDRWRDIAKRLSVQEDT